MSYEVLTKNQRRDQRRAEIARQYELEREEAEARQKAERDAFDQKVIESLWRLAESGQLRDAIREALKP